MENTTDQRKNFLNRVLHLDLTEAMEQMGLTPDYRSKNDGLAFYNKLFDHPVLAKEVIAVKGQSWHFLNDLETEYDLIDLVTLRDHLSVKDGLEKIYRHCSVPPSDVAHPLAGDPYRLQSSYQIDQRKPIMHSGPLAAALGLPVALLHMYAQGYELKENKNLQLAIGLAGNPHGNHLLLFDRVRDGKTSLLGEFSNRDEATIIIQGSKFADVFESVQDYLHYLNRIGHTYRNDAVILPDVINLEKTLPQLESYQQVNLFLHNAPLQNQHKGYAEWLDPRFKDFSMLYKGYKSMKDERINVLQQVAKEKKIHNRL